MHYRPCRLALLSLATVALCLGQSEDQLGTKQKTHRIRELGKKDTSVIPLLVPGLNDDDREVRDETVKALVRIGGPATLDGLIQATHDKDADVQQRATDGIVNVYVPGYVAQGLKGSLSRGVSKTKSLFASRNDQVIGQDVTVRSDAGEAVANLIGEGADSDARANAALASGILKFKDAVPALTQALRSKNDDVIFESLVALQKIHGISAGPTAAFLTHDLDERIQVTALETVGKFDTQEAAPDVRSALKSAKNLKVRRAALQALALLGQPSDRSTFLEYAKDRDATLRSSALEGLGRVREPEDFPVLQAAFDEGEIDWHIHDAAAFAMVNEGKVDTGEFDPLTYLFEGLGSRSRNEVASAYLAELLRREAVQAVLANLVPKLSKDQKLALCPVLAKSHMSAVRPMLTSLSRDADGDVAAAAARGLKSLDNSAG